MIAATTGYRWGLLWIAAATLAPPLLLAVHPRRRKADDAGVCRLSLGTSFGLLAAVILRSGGDLRIVSCFFRMLFHWFYYGWEDRLPPWVFHSPCGGWLQRQAWMLLAVGLLAIPLTSLAAHSFAGLQEAVQAQLAPILAMALDRPDGARGPVVAPLNLCLIGILLTGKVISAYQ